MRQRFGTVTAISYGADVESAADDDLDLLRAIEERIVGYFADHPRAADAADGVCQWWLGDLVCSEDHVERALDRLAERGVVATRVLADGNIVYFLAPQRGSAT